MKTLSGLVSNLVIKKQDGNYFQSGTAIFIKNKSDFYAATAKHCFIDNSTQLEKTIPTLSNTCDEIAFMTGLDTSGKVNLLHRERLHDREQLLFDTYYINENQAIDIAALKLSNPNDAVKGISIDSDYLDNSGIINYNSNLQISGFPSYSEDIEDTIITSFAPEYVQEMLDGDKEYYFIMPSNIDLSTKSLAGFSGAAILNTDSQKLIGFVAGENKKANLIYGIYAKYMTECLK
jgi:hypothetical protein